MEILRVCAKVPSRHRRPDPLPLMCGSHEKKGTACLPNPLQNSANTAGSSNCKKRLSAAGCQPADRICASNGATLRPVSQAHRPWRLSTVVENPFWQTKPKLIDYPGKKITIFQQRALTSRPDTFSKQLSSSPQAAKHP